MSKECTMKRQVLIQSAGKGHVFPKNSSGVGFSFSFLEKGAWNEIGRTLPNHCPNIARPPRSRLRETAIFM